MPKSLANLFHQGKFIFDLEGTLTFNAIKNSIVIDDEIRLIGGSLWKKFEFITIKENSILMDNIIGDSIEYSVFQFSWDDGLPFLSIEGVQDGSQWNDCFCVYECIKNEKLILRNAKDGGGTYTYTVYKYSGK